jgi:hypothetical protein
VELDALQALRPGTLAQLVRAAIAPYRDATMQDRFMEVRHEAREAAEQAWVEQTAASRAELATIEAAIDGIVARYHARLAALNEELQAALEPCREPIATLRQAITEMAAGFDPELPDRPSPDIAEVDESAWRFESGRDYLEQMDVYQARKSSE